MNLAENLKPVDGMTNLAGIADEDFKAEGESSAPTEESKSDFGPDIDSDEILDDPATIDVLGEKKDVSHEPGKVTKEIIEVSTIIITFPEHSWFSLCLTLLTELICTLTDGRRQT